MFVCIFRINFIRFQFFQDYVCKSLLCLKMFAQLASTNWLFNEGYYLHSRITVNIFNTSDAPIKFFHALGWGKFLRITDKHFITLSNKPLSEI